MQTRIVRANEEEAHHSFRHLRGVDIFVVRQHRPAGLLSFKGDSVAPLSDNTPTVIGNGLCQHTGAPESDRSDLAQIYRYLHRANREPL